MKINSKSDVVDVSRSKLIDLFLSLCTEEHRILLGFFDPGNPDCQALAPIYEELATSFRSLWHKLTVAKIDCTIYSDICSLVGVKTYPTLKLFEGYGKIHDNHGGLDLQSLIQYVANETGSKPDGINVTSSLVRILSQS